MAYRIRLRSFSSLSLLSYDRVFCIHEVLSRMDEFCHGLRLFFVKFVDEEIGITPLWNAASSNLSSTSSTVRAFRLKRVIKDRKLSFSPYSMVNRLDEKRLCLCPPIKLLTNNLLNSSKELTELRGILLNHTRAGPLRVVGKALHIISSRTP